MVILGLLLIAAACGADLPGRAKFRSEQRADVAGDVGAVEDGDAPGEIALDALVDAGAEVFVDVHAGVDAASLGDADTLAVQDDAIDAQPDAPDDAAADVPDVLAADVPDVVVTDAEPDSLFDVETATNPCAGKQCDDGDACTIDTCSPASGTCVFTFSAAICQSWDKAIMDQSTFGP